MISLIRGKIAEKSDRTLIIDVGGVGYGVTVPMSTFSDLSDTGTEVELKVHTHITEKSFELFGFLTDSEKNLFQCLIGVSGVGPKVAITIFQGHSPQEMSLEDIFFAKNVRSAIKLGQSRGIAMLAAEEAGLRIYEYSPTKVKLAITGSGRAKKFEVMKMVSYALGIDNYEKDDISDALAIALCHINFSNYAELAGLDIKPRSGRKRSRFTLDDITNKRQNSGKI